MTTTSQDFLDWAEPAWVDYAPGRLTQLYTNQILPYHRTPHIFLGFPTRYITGRRHLTALNEHISTASMRFGTDYSDGGFMTSRDGQLFDMWPEGFIRPGPTHQGRWAYGGGYQALGLLETATETAPAFLQPYLPAGVPRELSLYSTEDGWVGTSRGLRRYTLRLDGFVSAYARQSGGELITKPFTFRGEQLLLNAATSAAGLIGVEVQDASSGCAIEGFAMSDCEELFGDAIEMPVRWTGGRELGELAGIPVRLRIVLHDADLYALQFRAAGAEA